MNNENFPDRLELSEGYVLEQVKTTSLDNVDFRALLRSSGGGAVDLQFRVSRNGIWEEWQDVRVEQTPQ